MLTKTNKYGTVSIDEDVISGITSIVASKCFGIAGMESKNATEEFWSLFKKDTNDKGIQVRCIDNEIEIDLHIMVVYGINIPAITDSIVHKVAYTVEDATGFNVKCVNVYVDKVNTK
jgi:uncharacterized alkaline shock family protein YloU